MEFIGIINVLGFMALLYGVPIALFVLWLTPKLSRSTFSHGKYPIALFGIGILTVAVTWYALFGSIVLSTNRILVPWDLFALQAPPPSTWERQFNDFFDRFPGSFLPATVVTGVSVWLFAVRLGRAIVFTEHFRLFLVFALSNLALIVVSTLLIVPLRDLLNLWLSQTRPPIDVRYHRTWLDFLGTTMLVLLLLFIQANGMRLRRSERIQP